MSSEIDKLQKEVATLTQKQGDIRRKLDTTHERRIGLETQRNGLLLCISENDEGARRDLRRLDQERQNAIENEQAFSAALADTSGKLTAAKKSLHHAEDASAVASLEAEIANFAVLDRELQQALRVVAEKSGTLIAAVNTVGARLTQRDEKKFGQLAAQLVTQIRRSIFFFIEEMSKPNAVPRPTFSETIQRDMERLICELRFELVGRRMTATGGHSLYRVRIAGIPGLCGVDARAGDVVALLPKDPETLRLLKDQSIEPTADAEQPYTEMAIA